jgi:FdhE protein
MQRILDPAQIEAFAERSIPRVRLPDSAVFAQRAQRLRSLSANHSLREYLLLMAALADAQQVQFDWLRSALAAEGFAQHIGKQIELAQEHRMPVLQAAGWPRQDRWRTVLRALCGAVVDGSPGLAIGTADRGVSAVPDTSLRNSSASTSKGAKAAAAGHHSPPATGSDTGAIRNAAGHHAQSAAGAEVKRAFPPAVYALCKRIMAAPDAELNAQADLLIASRSDGVDGQAAPFVMAALQVYWAAMASTLRESEVAQLDVATVCPVCGTLPVASIVRSDKRGPQGYRYLHCGLCETEWHMVRITCSNCLTTEGITYNAIEGGSEAVRAETCGKCHTYRKILYQEKDTGVEPVADDLASLALDLLMTEDGFHRGSGNPLLWQTSEA